MKKDVVKELKLKGKSREFIKIIIAILEKENVVNYKETLQDFYNNIAWQVWYNKNIDIKTVSLVCQTVCQIEWHEPHNDLE